MTIEARAQPKIVSYTTTNHNDAYWLIMLILYPNDH